MAWGWVGMLAAAYGLKGLRWLMEGDGFLAGPRRPPVTFEEFEIPRIEDGTPIPLYFGHVRVRSPIVGWMDGLHSDQATYDGVTVDRWTANFLYVLGMPLPSTVVRLTEIWIGDRRVSQAVAGSSDPNDGPFPLVGNTASAFADDFTFMGGPLRGGGIRGKIEFRSGSPDVSPAQTWVGSQHEARWKATATDPVDPTGALLPGYRGMSVCALSGWRFGERLNMEPYHFGLYASCDGSSTGGYAPLQSGANPMAVLRGLITSPWPGLNYPDSVIDDASFDAVAATLAAENHGVNGVVYNRAAALAYIRDILDQTEVAFYRDRTDGKFHVKAIRNDYDPGTVPVFDRTNVVVISKFDQTAYQDTPNEVTVEFTDQNRDFLPGSHTVQNSASITLNNHRIRSARMQYPMCTQQWLAARLAARDLAALSIPTFVAQLAVDQSQYKRNPGDAIKLKHPEFNWVDGVLCRVIGVEHGKLTDERLLVTVILDRFGVNYGLAENPPEFGFPEQPVVPPLPIVRHKIMECPALLQTFAMFNQYIINEFAQRLYHACSDPGLSAIDEGFIAARVDPATPGNLIQETTVDRTFAGYATVETLFPRERDPYVTVAGDGLRLTNLHGHTLQSATFDEITNRGRNLVLVGDELMSFESATDLGGSPKVWRLQNVWRGLLDTVPVDHPVGTPIFFLDDNTLLGLGRHIGNGVFDGEVGQNHDTIIVPRASAGYMPVARARRIDVPTIRCRRRTPLPVADLLVSSTITGSNPGLSTNKGGGGTIIQDGMTLSWRRRAVGNKVIRGDAAGHTVPASTTYRLIGKKRGVEAQLVPSDENNTSVGLSYVPIGPIGHGMVEIGVRTKADVEIVDTVVPFDSWQDAMVRLDAKHYRNLCLNPRFTADLSQWTATNASRGTTAGSAHGGGGAYVFGTGNGDYNIKQRRSVLGYVGAARSPNALSAVLSWYAIGTDTLDHTKGKIEFFDEDGVSLGSTELDQAITTVWTYRQTTLVAPDDTVSIEITLTGTAQELVPSTVRMSDVTLRFGQATTNQAANPSFESGTASWTVGTGAWVTGLTTTKYDLTNYIRGGANNTNTLTQTINVPAGYERDSVCVVEVATMRDGSDTNDTGNIAVAGSSGSTEAETGIYTPATDSVWERKLVALPLGTGTDPDTTVTVTLTANRVGDAGDANICFDDVRVHFFKEIDQDFADEQKATFSPSVAHVPQSVEDWVYCYPTLSNYPRWAVWGGASAQPTSRQGPPISMVDSGITLTTKFAGPWNGERASYDAMRFPGGVGAGHLSSDGNNTFARGDGFWVLLWIRIDPRDHGATAREIIGCKDTVGWEITTTAAGLVKAKVYGTVTTNEITSAAAINDGRPHLIGAHIKSGGDVSVIVDGVIADAGSVTTGSIRPDPSDPVKFRIGRSTSGGNGCPCQIAGVYFGLTPYLTNAELTAMWSHGKDPGAGTNAACSMTGGAHGAVTIPHPGGGVGVLRLRTDALPIAWDPVGGKWGLAESMSVTNVAPTQDFANAAWTTVGSPTWVTSGVEDAEGWLRGAQLTGDNTKYARLDLNGIGTQTRVVVTFFARLNAGSGNMRVELVDDTPTVLDTEVVALTDDWQRVDLALDWSAHSGADGGLRFYASNTGAAQTIQLSGPVVVHYFNGADPQFPIVLPYEGQATVGNQQVSFTSAQVGDPIVGGQITLTGRCSLDDGLIGILATLGGNATDNDRRELWLADQEVRLTHYNASATPVVSEVATAGALDAAWKIEGRWSRAGMIDNPAQFSGLEFNDTGDYDGVSAFTVGTTTYLGLKFGTAGNMPNAYIYTAQFSHREVQP